MINFSAHDCDIAGRTAWGEARNQGWIGQIAVLWTVRNRAELILNGLKRRQFGDGTIAGACLVPLQYTCWNDSDPNLPLLRAVSLQKDAAFRQCYAAAAAVLIGSADDPTSGATHYHTKEISPSWAAGRTPVAEIGKHIFYKGV